MGNGVLSSEAIPVITRVTINFEPYQYNAQQEALDRQGRAVTLQVPQTQGKGLGVVINSLVGSPQVGYKDFGYEEFEWGEAATPPLAGVHSGLTAWQDIIAGPAGAAVVDAGKDALLNMIRGSIPSFAADLPDGLSVELSARLQRLETVLRWDAPQNNQVVAYVQFAGDAEFTRKMQTVPFIFWPPETIAQRLPREQEETDEAYAARLPFLKSVNNVGDLRPLLSNASFKTLAKQIYSLVFAQLKLKANRYKNIDVDAIGNSFDGCYTIIENAAGPLPLPPVDPVPPPPATEPEPETTPAP